MFPGECLLAYRVVKAVTFLAQYALFFITSLTMLCIRVKNRITSIQNLIIYLNKTKGDLYVQ
ncbi:MAG: hypothetical protein COB92_07125 [Robiginitomaculum sp.]|nr:MAG: hypothetical protein COB92_07125 [Robiginitomaculum sp.]